MLCELPMIPGFPPSNYPLQPLSKNIVGRGGEPAGTRSVIHEFQKTRHCRVPASAHAAGADLADAPGRTLSARISGSARTGEELPRAVLHAGTRGRGDAAADPALSAR